MSRDEMTPREALCDELEGFFEERDSEYLYIVAGGLAEAIVDFLIESKHLPEKYNKRHG